MKTIKPIILCLCFLCLLVVFSLCTNDNEEDITETSTCDTINVNYNTIAVIFDAYCLNCHNSNKTDKEGIILDSYENLKASITNYDEVLKSIKHESGVKEMPLFGSKLEDCKIAIIEAWVNKGMPEK